LPRRRGPCARGAAYHTAAGLDERYARGEITREQYFELKADIASA